MKSSITLVKFYPGPQNYMNLIIFDCTRKPTFNYEIIGSGLVETPRRYQRVFLFNFGARELKQAPLPRLQSTWNCFHLHILTLTYSHESIQNPASPKQSETDPRTDSRKESFRPTLF